MDKQVTNQNQKNQSNGGKSNNNKKLKDTKLNVKNNSNNKLSLGNEGGNKNRKNQDNKKLNKSVEKVKKPNSSSSQNNKNKSNNNSKINNDSSNYNNKNKRQNPTKENEKNNKKVNSNNNETINSSSYVQTQNDDVKMKNSSGKVIRTSGYRHKKRRNKHLFISDNDSPSQIKYNYKYERVNSDKKREQQQQQQMEEMMKKNQSTNIERNQKQQSNKNNKNKLKDSQSNQSFFSIKTNSSFSSSSSMNAGKNSSDKKNMDKNVKINNKYPLNHLYDAFTYLGQNKSIRNAKAWYDSNPLFMVDYDEEIKNKDNQVCVTKLSFSIASAYASNYSPKTWHLINYKKRNPNTTTLKANTKLSKKIRDHAAELKKSKKRTNDKEIKNAFDACPISLIHYPEYNPFDAEDGIMEDYEPFYDYQIKLNNYINNLSKEEAITESIIKTKLNVNAKSYVPLSASKVSTSLSSAQSIAKKNKTNSATTSTTTSTNSTQILSNVQVWNNYVKSRQEMKARKAEIRSKIVNQLKDATQRRKLMVQRPSPKVKKNSVSFKLNSLQSYLNQNSQNKKYYNNTNNKNKNSTYAKYVASYSIVNDINKLTNPSSNGYPINYNNVIERINNYYKKDTANTFDYQSNKITKNNKNQDNNLLFRQKT
ncbi:hypothetical protein BCR36DRAFT_586073, partial [Piromyces finnis]